MSKELIQKIRDTPIDVWNPKQTTLILTISTTKRQLIDKVKDTVNNALLDMENRGDILFWDIQEGEN